jgi:hypothetical protein
MEACGTACEELVAWGRRDAALDDGSSIQSVWSVKLEIKDLAFGDGLGCPSSNVK